MQKLSQTFYHFRKITRNIETTITNTLYFVPGIPRAESFQNRLLATVGQKGNESATVRTSDSPYDLKYFSNGACAKKRGAREAYREGRSGTRSAGGSGPLWPFRLGGSGFLDRSRFRDRDVNDPSHPKKKFSIFPRGSITRKFPNSHQFAATFDVPIPRILVNIGAKTMNHDSDKTCIS